MTAYPADLVRRFSDEMKKLRRDVAKLKTRTAAIDSGMPLAVLPGVIDSGYSSGDPRCYVNGSATLSGPFQHLASYSPSAGDTVLVIPVPLTANGLSSSYVILGRVS